MKLKNNWEALKASKKEIAFKKMINNMKWTKHPEKKETKKDN